ncbi:hypothetical protein ABTQ08_20625, partial [Acinetobacter baumannii]
MGGGRAPVWFTLAACDAASACTAWIHEAGWRTARPVKFGSSMIFVKWFGWSVLWLLPLLLRT